MKIAYFLDVPKGLGGAGNVLLEQAKLMSTIHEVIVIIPCDIEGKVNSEYELRCKKAHIRYRGMVYSTAYTIQDIDVLDAYRAAKSIQEMVLEEDVNFFHSVQLNIGVELVSRELNIPHLMNIYSIKNEEFSLLFMDIFPRYHSCDSVLYCNLWNEKLGMKTRCIRPSAPLPLKKKEVRKKDTLRILMLGGVIEYKNQMLAIKAVELCGRNHINISLSIAGDDHSEYADNCKRYLRESGLENNIHILGFRSDIVPLLEKHDCYLCTSVKESFPSSIVESMTYGLAIISTPVAGVPELLKDKVNAYISKGYEVKDIADCIMECFHAYQDGSINKIYENAEILWKENFSQDIVRQQLNEYYQYILSDYVKNAGNELENKISRDSIEQIYMKLYHAGIEDEEVLSKSYYYTCLTQILKTGTVYIWGAGKYGRYAKELLKVLFPEMKILAYIDRKKTGEYLGIPVISPEQIKWNSFNYIFLGFTQGREHVIKYLGERKLKYNKDIWLLP